MSQVIDPNSANSENTVLPGLCFCSGDTFTAELLLGVLRGAY